MHFFFFFCVKYRNFRKNTENSLFLRKFQYVKGNVRNIVQENKLNDTSGDFAAGIFRKIMEEFLSMKQYHILHLTLSKHSQVKYVLKNIFLPQAGSIYILYYYNDLI